MKTTIFRLTLACTIIGAGLGAIIFAFLPNTFWFTGSFFGALIGLVVSTIPDAFEIPFIKMVLAAKIAKSNQGVNYLPWLIVLGLWLVSLTLNIFVYQTDQFLYWNVAAMIPLAMWGITLVTRERLKKSLTETIFRFVGLIS